MLTLVISTAVARASRPANRVDFINEQNAGRILFRLLKHIADAARTDTHKHLHKIRTRDREERHARFPRNGPRKKGLTRARRAFQQGPFGNFTAQSAKFLRILQKINNFFQLFFGFINARDIVKCDIALLFRQHLRAALAKAHGSAFATALHPVHEIDPHPN